MGFLDVCRDKKVFGIFDADLDGVGARIIAEFFIEPICSYIPLNTAHRDMRDVDIKLALASEIIIFVDIAPTLELYNYFITQNKIVYIFDHHQTSKDILGDIPNYFFDLERCGTKIFYDHITLGKRKNRVIYQFAELVNTYDTWQQESALWQDARNLSNCMYGYVNWWLQADEADTIKYEKFIDSQLRKFERFKVFKFTAYEEKLIQKAKEKELNAYNTAKQNLVVRKDGKGNKYIYFEAPSKLSYVSNKLLKEYSDDIEYTVGRGTFDKNSTKVSLRSLNDFNVAFIAEKWGGGGHQNAAGVELEKDEFFSFKSGNLHLI